MISAHYNTITTFILENKIKIFSYFEYKYSSACFLFRRVHFFETKTKHYDTLKFTQHEVKLEKYYYPRTLGQIT